MKPSLVAREIISGTCILYTGIVLFLCLMLAGEVNMQVSPQHFLLIFPFSALVSAATFLHRRTKWNRFCKFFVHFIATVGGFTLFIFLPIQSENRESTFFLLLLLFTVIYLIFYGAVMLFVYRWNRMKNEESAYTPVYTKNNKTKK